MNLYWWNDIPNVGDVASEYVISKLSDENIKWKEPQRTIPKYVKKTIKNILKGKFKISSLTEFVYPWEKCLFAIGSILDFANKKTICWGSGFREPYSKFRGGTVVAVRGKLSRDILPHHQEIPLGDPALLLPLLYKPKVENRQDFIKIIPHFLDYNDMYEQYSNKYKIIDIRTKNVESFIDQIVSSKFILSTSLHGLIIAHAYGIPALWIIKGSIASSGFKFYDYFSSVNIPQYNGFTNINEILSCHNNIEKLFEENADKSQINISLKELQHNLLRVAPFKLKSQYYNV